ncbi:hypothetical protein H2202_003094 [Exophiala xenobiotica]|nr:hypothetical protein H2202_003094 [Exophiala xenobiotica]KAK5199853.1 hypothetical protein LTR92_000394 [Exophiala xenobiotica]KAK5211022.1 hypothetical protein LTR41_003634 [Exophiala xenobiotica]KAK5237475.1 hypothetical protein LTR47_001741 [Exophiala xenobiotica]KAK5254607.1 hypothetical protein LTS06_001097 [Exophiala xenobiotica]
MSADQSSDSQSQPSMLGAHAKYVQGAVSSALGYESGEQTKEAAVQEMRDAKAQSSDQQPAQSTILGSVEKTAGQVTGCEGMIEEGQERIPQKAGIEETNGTG